VPPKSAITPRWPGRLLIFSALDAIEQEIANGSRQRRKSDARHTDEDKLDDALKDSFPASDPVSFIQPAPKEPNDAPLDKERERNRWSGALKALRDRRFVPVVAIG